jgi:alpha-N-arabinofuranosidase
MEMYNVHQDATLIPVTVKTNDYVLGAEKLPAVSASVSKDAEGKIHISLVNIDAAKSQDIAFNLPAGKYATITGRILTSAKLQDHNSSKHLIKLNPLLSMEQF